MKNCLKCGKEIIQNPKSKPMFYCSPSCRVLFHRKKPFLKELETNRQKYLEYLKTTSPDSADNLNDPAQEVYWLGWESHIDSKL